MKKALEEFLVSIGEDPTREGLAHTPERWQEALRELTKGYDEDIDNIFKDGIFKAESEGRVTVDSIAFHSLCEHHILPFFGTVSVSYVPNEHIIGLGKIPRIVDVFAARLQTQERLTEEIADTLYKALKPQSLEVTVKAEHLCMKMRGVKRENGYLTTSVEK